MPLAISASRASFSVEGQNPGSEDYNGILGYIDLLRTSATMIAYHIFFCLFSVKLRIKSFTIPELFIEIPENATVGSLKVKAILASGS